LKTPPPADQHLVPVSEAGTERDPRFLAFAGLVLVALALGFKSEMAGPGQV